MHIPMPINAEFRPREHHAPHHLEPNYNKLKHYKREELIQLYCTYSLCKRKYLEVIQLSVIFIMLLSRHTTECRHESTQLEMPGT